MSRDRGRCTASRQRHGSRIEARRSSPAAPPFAGRNAASGALPVAVGRASATCLTPADASPRGERKRRSLAAGSGGKYGSRRPSVAGACFDPQLAARSPDRRAGARPTPASSCSRGSRTRRRARRGGRPGAAAAGQPAERLRKSETTRRRSATTLRRDAASVKVDAHRAACRAPPGVAAAAQQVLQRVEQRRRPRQAAAARPSASVPNVIAPS